MANPLRGSPGVRYSEPLGYYERSQGFGIAHPWACQKKCRSTLALRQFKRVDSYRGLLDVPRGGSRVIGGGLGGLLLAQRDLGLHVADLDLEIAREIHLDF